jgi:hypothetical protein
MGQGTGACCTTGCGKHQGYDDLQRTPFPGYNPRSFFTRSHSFFVASVGG